MGHCQSQPCLLKVLLPFGFEHRVLVEAILVCLAQGVIRSREAGPSDFEQRVKLVIAQGWGNRGSKAKIVFLPALVDV